MEPPGTPKATVGAEATPERIESGWWMAPTRDYFVAEMHAETV
jgi:hypothetical protein